MSLIEILLILLFLLFPLGQLGRIPLNNPEIGFYVHDLVIIMILMVWLAGKIEQGKPKKMGKLGKSILIFWLAAGISFLLNAKEKNPEEVLTAFLYLARWGGYAGLYFVLVDLKIKKIFNNSLSRWLILAGVVSAFFGLIQYLFYPDIRLLTVLEWDPHYYRVVGTFLEPGFSGLIYVLTLILITLTFWPGRLKKRLNTEGVCLFMIVYAAFILTYSRSAYLAYLAGMTMIAFFKKSLKFFFLFLIFFMVSTAILPRPGGEGVKLERQASIWSRFQSWQQGLIIGSKKPLLGVGFNFYRYAQRDAGFLDKKNWNFSHAGAGADNSFIFIFATCGFVGLFFYSRLIYKIIKTALKNIYRKPFFLVVLASLGALLTHAVFNNSLFYAWIMIWFWLMAGIMENN